MWLQQSFIIRAWCSLGCWLTSMKLFEQPGKLHHYRPCLFSGKLLSFVYGLSLTRNYWLFTLLQRYRYIQAYQVDLRLQKIEEAFVSDNQIGEEVMFRMRSQSHWRKELVVSISANFPCTSGSFHSSLLKATSSHLRFSA